jgi:hypothetical protein
MTIGTQLLNHPVRLEPRILLGWTTLAAGAFVLLFWTIYFTAPAVLGQDDPLKATFEGAFPLADLTFAGALLGTGVLFLRRHPGAPFLLVVAAAMSVYLGILDVTFYAGHGFYTPLTSDAVTELGINALCIGCGALGLRAGWQLWRAA